MLRFDWRFVAALLGLLAFVRVSTPSSQLFVPLRVPVQSPVQQAAELQAPYLPLQQPVPQWVNVQEYDMVAPVQVQPAQRSLDTGMLGWGLLGCSAAALLAVAGRHRRGAGLPSPGPNGPGGKGTFGERLARQYGGVPADGPHRPPPVPAYRRVPSPAHHPPAYRPFAQQPVQQSQQFAQPPRQYSPTPAPGGLVPNNSPALSLRDAAAIQRGFAVRDRALHQTAADVDAPEWILNAAGTEWVRNTFGGRSVNPSDGLVLGEGAPDRSATPRSQYQTAPPAPSSTPYQTAADVGGPDWIPNASGSDWVSNSFGGRAVNPSDGLLLDNGRPRPQSRAHRRAAPPSPPSSTVRQTAADVNAPEYIRNTAGTEWINNTFGGRAVNPSDGLTLDGAVTPFAPKPFAQPAPQPVPAPVVESPVLEDPAPAEWAAAPTTGAAQSSELDAKMAWLEKQEMGYAPAARLRSPSPRREAAPMYTAPADAPCAQEDAPCETGMGSVEDAAKAAWLAKQEMGYTPAASPAPQYGAPAAAPVPVPTADAKAAWLAKQETGYTPGNSRSASPAPQYSAVPTQPAASEDAAKAAWLAKQETGYTPGNSRSNSPAPYSAPLPSATSPTMYDAPVAVGLAADAKAAWLAKQETGYTPGNSRSASPAPQYGAPVAAAAPSVDAAKAAWLAKQETGYTPGNSRASSPAPSPPLQSPPAAAMSEDAAKAVWLAKQEMDYHRGPEPSSGTAAAEEAVNKAAWLSRLNSPEFGVNRDSVAQAPAVPAYAVPTMTAPTMTGHGKGFGGGEATRDPEPTVIDPNDPKGKQQAIHKAESFAEYLAKRTGGL